MRDFITDTTAAIFDYADKQGLVPEFVKQSNIITKEDADQLPDRAFADQYNRLFPCHTKEATVVSSIYFLADGNGDPNTLDTIMKRAAAFGVEDDVNKVVAHFDNLVQEMQQQEKKASEEPQEPIEKYALTISNNDEEHNFYNISSRPDVLVSMNELERDYNCGAIEMPWMRKVAKILMDAAEQFNVADNAPGCIVKFAECRLPDLGKAQALLSMRTTCVDDMSMYNQAMEKLASSLMQAETFQDAVDVSDEFAKDVYVLDKQANVQYGAFQPDPYVVMLSGPSQEEFEKRAASHVYISDIPVPVEDVVNMSDQTVDMQFSKSSAECIKDAITPLRSGDVDSTTTSDCSIKLASLSPEVRLRLLQVLAGTGF